MPDAKTAPETMNKSDDFPYRYNAALANVIETKWQDRWDADHTYYTPNPTGDMSDGFNPAKKKKFILDMFPYPSGAGLHVGHPLGFIGTDVYARYLRMTGNNVLHAMGYDAFGLPAEQYAIQTNTHPRITTENNIANMKRQMRRVGLGHDERRGVSTIDPDYYKWTQWIFLTIYNSYFDEKTNTAQPIEKLIAEFESGERTVEDEQQWSALNDGEKASVIDEFRLAYLADSIVNWCPGLGTVLANEEVTADGKSERGNFDVFKRPMKQWMMRITKYADRLIDDLELLDWPDAIKAMQRNWIGKSYGMLFTAPIKDTDLTLQTFSAHFEAFPADVFVVIAPDHPFLPTLVEGLDNADEVLGYAAEMVKTRERAGFEEDSEYIDGIFTGRYIEDPVGNGDLPIWVASFALANYGTGIVKCSAHDERDFKFAKKYDIPLKPVLFPEDEAEAEKVRNLEYCYTDMVNGVLSEPSEFAGQKPDREQIIKYLVDHNIAVPKVSYKLRDWLFSRQRYWGEPFPIVFDEHGVAHAVPESMLPVTLPELDNFQPEASDDPNAEVKPPLARVDSWVNVELDLGDGIKKYRRETNTMPNWAGSCWYYLRYLDPSDEAFMVDPDIEKYWAADGNGVVDLYVGGVEHAVLHLLYARFWHKVLFDRGYVSTPEPFGRLINQGMIQAYAYKDDRGFYVDAGVVEERDGKYIYEGQEVAREYGKMGKSLKNVVTPDEMCENYGADTLRLYEMFMGPLEMSRPWSTADVAGVYRFLQRLWRNLIDEETGEINVGGELSDDLRRALHKTVAAVANDYSTLSYNTAIAKMFELNNELTKWVVEGNQCPREVADVFVRLLSPLVPHIAEELWEKLGNHSSVVYADFPVPNEKFLVDESIEIPVQILGKVKSRITVAPGSRADELEQAARADARIAELIEGKTVVKVIAVVDKMVNFVIK